jgi:phosphoglycerol transferase
MYSRRLLLSLLTLPFFVGLAGLTGCGPRPTDYATPIKFSSAKPPAYVKSLTGFHSVEPWGRWSSEAPTVIQFTEPLPQKFAVHVLVDVYGPNSAAPVKVKAGNAVKEVFMRESNKLYRIEIQTAEPVQSIEFIAPKPISPAEYAPPNTDNRKLGIGFKELRIEKLG